MQSQTGCPNSRNQAAVATLAPSTVPPIRKNALKLVAPVVVATTTLYQVGSASAYRFPKIAYM